MTHVEHLLELIKEGEKLRDQMRREMEVMAEIIERQNATAIKQGAMLVKAEKLKVLYKARMDARDKTAGKAKRQVKSLSSQLSQGKEYKARLKQYVLTVNNGVWPEELK